MYTLGIGDVTHDTSVCLMRNNEILVAIELERLTRIKHNLQLNCQLYSIVEQGKNRRNVLKEWTVDYRENQFNLAIDYCLEYANASAQDISTRVVSTLYKDPVYKEKSTFIDHHLAHSASTYYPSNFERSAILVMDGYGYLNEEGSSISTLFAEGNGNTISLLDAIAGRHDHTTAELQQGACRSHMVFTNSLGAFYQNVSMLLGMGYQGEGKTMGLASYGKSNPEFNKIRDYVTFLSNGKLEIDNRGLFLLVKGLLDRAQDRLTGKELFYYKADIAYAHQILLEKMILYLCHYLYKIAPSKNLCLAGGVALNSAANYKILQKTPFKNIFIQPAAGDSGISIGAALYGAHAMNNLPRSSLSTKKLFSPFLGKSYKKTEAYILQKSKIEKYRINLPEKDLYTEIARQISDKKIIGWFNDRCEIGPRALGARSILADPRDPHMKDVLNQRVKHRENFRPFAPAILEEEVGRYFENIGIAPYMLLIADAKENAKKEIPATIHVDNTARVQTVNAELNPNFYRLIKAFYLLTGVPVVLNTSFNLAGKPIVETPEDAIDCFLKMSLDGLYLDGNFYLKCEQPETTSYEFAHNL